jgi:predicted molibdopterin-dependent oxidoreductase YjgC
MQGNTMQNQAQSRSTVSLRVNGQTIHIPAGASVAAAILQAGAAFRTSVSGEPRAALCGMGICEECRATIDGVLHARTCQRVAAEGMEIVTG